MVSPNQLHPAQLVWWKESNINTPCIIININENTMQLFSLDHLYLSDPIHIKYNNCCKDISPLNNISIPNITDVTNYLNDKLSNTINQTEINLIKTIIDNVNDLQTIIHLLTSY